MTDTTGGEGNGRLPREGHYLSEGKRWEGLGSSLSSEEDRGNRSNLDEESPSYNTDFPVLDISVYSGPSL